MATEIYNWQNKTYCPESAYDLNNFSKRLIKAVAKDEARRKRKPLNWLQCVLCLPFVAILAAALACLGFGSVEAETHNG